MTLKDLAPGKRAVITEVKLEGSMKRRLIDMGLTPGTEVCVQRTAPLGDPIQFNVLGYSLTLRKADADKIEVEL